KDFFESVRFQPRPLLRLCCGLLRNGLPVELVHVRHVGSWNQVPVDVHSHLDRAVPHLVPYVGELGAGLDEQTSIAVSKIVKADLPRSEERRVGKECRYWRST